jgi:hypothetical protein
MSSRKRGGTSYSHPPPDLDHQRVVPPLYPAGTLSPLPLHHLRHIRRIILNSASSTSRPKSSQPLISHMPNNYSLLMEMVQKLLQSYVPHVDVTDNSPNLDTTCSWIRIIWIHSFLSHLLRMMGCRPTRVDLWLLRLCHYLVRRWDIIRDMGCCLSNLGSSMEGRLGGSQCSCILSYMHRSPITLMA